MRNRVSIRRRLVLFLLGTTSAALVLGFGAVLVDEIRTLRREMLESTTTVARVTADSTIVELAFGDVPEARRTLARMETMPHTLSAAIYDRAGRLFADWHREGSEPPARLSGPATSGFSRTALTVAVPIDHSGERYGSLVLRTSKEPLDARIRRRMLSLGAILAVLLGLATVAASRLARVFSEPVVELSAVARRISESGDSALRVAKRRNDEIGDLCDEFNGMLDRIEARERERDSADQRSREKSRFLANMSHELRTPLNSIIGFAEVLENRLSGQISAKESKFLRNIHASGQHLLGIINDILDLSKIEAGRMEIHIEEVSVRDCVDGVAWIMRGMSERKSISIEIDVPGDLRAVLADPVKLKQILYNLVSNAVKFSPSGSTVDVRARRVAPGESPIPVAAVAIAVEDHGIGISQENLPNIFEEFRQIDGGTSREFEGTGLGLALVLRLVEMQGGRVRVRSEAGKGSVFTVWMPEARPGPASDDGSSRLEDSRSSPASTG